MKYIILPLILLFVCNCSFAQNKFSLRTQPVRFNSSSKTQFYNTLHYSNSRGGDGTGGKIVSSILGAAGGALIGWPLGTALGGGDPQWALAAVGAGLVAIAIPIAIISDKKAKESGRTYIPNTDRHYVASPHIKRIDLIANGNEAGLRLQF